MIWLDALVAGASGVFSWPGILIPVAGTLLAMITAFLPGVGNTSLAALLLVLTIGWDSESVLLLFGAITGGATFMGSITAILFNIPGSVSSTPTLLDGYPMGQRGLPRTAIACAATASAVGSVFGVLILIAILPVVRPLLLEFGPLERLLVGVWGLMTIVSVPTTSPLKAAIMAALGLVTAMIGIDPGSALPRWDFGSLELTRGFSLIPVLLGIFTFSELISWMHSVQLKNRIPQSTAEDDSVKRGFQAVFKNLGLTLRSSGIGTMVGMIPGVGGTVAGFVAYGQAVQSARGDNAEFGKGDIRGLIAPEAAIDAKDGGSLLPALAFGLPGSEAGVMLLAVFSLHGIVPGLPMLSSQLPLTFLLIIALLFSNILTSILGLALAPWLARLKHLPIDKIALPCLLVSLLAVLQINSQVFDLYTAVGFGIAGYYWRQYDWPRVPFVIAFVLGSLIETNLVITVQLVELNRITFFDSVAAMVLVGMILVSMVWLRTKKTAIELSRVKLAGDLSLGLILTLMTGALALIALSGGAAYSLYARALIVAVFTLCMIALYLTWRTGVSQRAGFKENPVLILTGLLPPTEHRMPLMLMVFLCIAIMAVGISAAVGMVTAIWLTYRAPNTLAARTRSGILGLVTGAATYYFVNNIAGMVLPESLFSAVLDM